MRIYYGIALLCFIGKLAAGEPPDGEGGEEEEGGSNNLSFPTIVAGTLGCACMTMI